jgi:hypothetical protein
MAPSLFLENNMLHKGKYGTDNKGDLKGYNSRRASGGDGLKDTHRGPNPPAPKDGHRTDKKRAK